MNFYKAEGDSGYTLYVETIDSLYCEVHHPSGDISDVMEVSEQYSIERIKGQLGAEPIAKDETGGLFGVKGQILDMLESSDDGLTIEEMNERIERGSLNTIYGAAKHLRWDDLVENDLATGKWRKR